MFELFVSSVLTTDGRFVREYYYFWLREQLARLKPRAVPILKQLLARPGCKTAFTKFLRAVRVDPGLSEIRDMRCWLAVYRAVEPLGDGEMTWGVERTLEDMDGDGDLSAYLKAALQREEILMDRERDFDRFGVCRPRMSREEWMVEVYGVPDGKEVGIAVPPDFWNDALDEEQDE